MTNHALIQFQVYLCLVSPSTKIGSNIVNDELWLYVLLKISEFFLIIVSKWHHMASYIWVKIESDNSLLLIQCQVIIKQFKNIVNWTPRNQIAVKFELKCNNFQSRKCRWKCNPRNGSHTQSWKCQYHLNDNEISILYSQRGFPNWRRHVYAEIPWQQAFIEPMMSQMA